MNTASRENSHHMRTSEKNHKQVDSGSSMKQRGGQRPSLDPNANWKNNGERDSIGLLPVNQID